jgi:hypothetical protein
MDANKTDHSLGLLGDRTLRWRQTGKGESVDTPPSDRPLSVISIDSHVISVIREGIFDGYVFVAYPEFDYQGSRMSWIRYPAELIGARTEQHANTDPELDADALIALAETRWNDERLRRDPKQHAFSTGMDFLRRAETAEERAETLERERDAVVEALHDAGKILEGLSLASVQGWMDRATEARTEADRLRGPLRDIATRGWRDEGGRIAAAIARDALAGPQSEECDHDWKDMRNANIESGEWCSKCGAVRAGNALPGPQTERRDV